MTHTHTGADTYKELYTWLLRAPLFPAQSCFSAALVKGKNLLPLCPRRLFLLRRFLIQIRITIKPDLSSAFVFPPPPPFFLFFLYLLWHRFEYPCAQSASPTLCRRRLKRRRVQCFEPRLQTRLEKLAKKRKRRKHVSVCISVYLTLFLT